MKDDILGKVVEVEKELAKDLANEKKKAAERLEKLRIDSEKEIVREEKRLQYALDKAVSEVNTEAGEKASKLLEDARACADMLEEISDDVLMGFIRQYTLRILP